MSRTYDGKQYALLAYPDDRDNAVRLLLDYLDTTESDFEYENKISPELYLFGDAVIDGDTK